MSQSENIFIQFNDQMVAAKHGQTILQAARQNGIQIPTLCDFPGLPPHGSCRLCVVEIEGKPNTPTACTTPVEDGMVISTHSPKVVALRRELLQRGYALQLLDVKPIDPCYANERSVVVDITDQASLTAALRGCDAVVHLAACTTDAPWPEHVKLSIEGSISLFDAAREAGVMRVVYASSHHVVGLHPRAPNGPRLGATVQVRPDSRYAVGKAFGESIGAMYAGKYGMQVLAIRIGNVNTRPIDRRRMGNWLSWRDLGLPVAH